MRFVHALKGSSFALAWIALDAMAPTSLRAQVVQGTVRSGSTSTPLGGARITVTDSAGTVYATTTTNEAGLFRLRAPANQRFQLSARRLGFEVLTASLKPLAPSDTAEFEYMMTELAATVDAVLITAENSLNQRRLAEATRRGWTIAEPELVARYREQAQDLNQLLRALALPGLLLPRGVNDCIRTVRSNQCLTYILDEQVLGFSAIVLPSDIYFLAILGASESRIQYGDRAPYGAIAIYTRSRLDRVRRSP